MKAWNALKWVSLLTLVLLAAGCGSSDGNSQPGDAAAVPPQGKYASSVTLSQYEQENAESVEIELSPSSAHSPTVIEAVAAPDFYMSIESDGQNTEVKKILSDHAILWIGVNERSSLVRKIVIGIPERMPVLLVDGGSRSAYIRPGDTFEIGRHEFRRKRVISEGMANRFAGPQ